MKRKPFYPSRVVERWIREEKADIALHAYLEYTNTNPKGTNMDRAVIKVSYQGFPVELSIDFVDDEINLNHIIGMIDHAKEKGFTAPVSYNKTGDEKIGKIGVVGTIIQGEKTKTGLQMYIVNGKLEDGSEFSWNEFTPTTFRKGDKFKVVRNDRKFLVGEIILPDMGGSEVIPF